ncbi:MAG TPA: LacI family DNA-binding transcriptional regulator [Ktedonobacterales bacterium]|jgi:LacI family transcriptional regulator|nr:LacI family DNA-binding transcriptional regulator [Ktedonobacterales bacterium]
MHNMHEVARRAGVSLGTVSNVLNHPELVSAETRIRVQRAIDELGFVRNGSARQLRVGSTQSIGLVVLDVTNPFFTEVARGAEDAASERGYIVILCNSDNSPRKEKNYLRVLEEQRVAGILIVPVEDKTNYARALRRSSTSVVLLDRVSHDANTCSVSVDDVYGGELAGRHLLEIGHRRIAYIHGPFSSAQYADRLTGLRRAVADAKLDPEEAIVSLAAETDNAHAGAACVEAFLKLADRPTAIFCGNDYLAMGVMYELARRQVAVAQDVALIGYDDIDLAPMLAVPLTTIRQPKYDLGFAATDLLLDEIVNKESHAHRQIVFRPELIVRQSTGEH